MNRPCAWEKGSQSTFAWRTGVGGVRWQGDQLGLGKSERGRLLCGAWEDKACRQTGGSVGDQEKRGAAEVAADQRTCL